MKLKFCAACGKIDDLQHHHLVPRNQRGSNDETNLITLFLRCHDKVHDRQHHGMYNHRQALRDGRDRARERGVVFGRKPKLTQHQRLEAIAKREAGETVQSPAHIMCTIR
jgi:5-methylcytosine-specific restriction endonuclease McrA